MKYDYHRDLVTSHLPEGEYIVLTHTVEDLHELINSCVEILRPFRPRKYIAKNHIRNIIMKLSNIIPDDNSVRACAAHPVHDIMIMINVLNRVHAKNRKNLDTVKAREIYTKLCCSIASFETVRKEESLHG